MPSDLFYIGTLHVELDYQSIDNFILVKFKIHFGFVISGWPVSQLVSCQDALTFQKFFNFPMVDLREDFTLGDLLHSIGVSKKLFNTNLIQFTSNEKMAHKLQYCAGRELLLLGLLSAQM